MSKLIPHAKKFWIYGAAVALIIGSSSTMVYALNENIPANASANASITATLSPDNNQTPGAISNITAKYNLVDLSKNVPDAERTKLIKDKLSLNKNFTPEEIEEKYQTIIASSIPGEKDLAVEQAAVYAAAILEKAYGVDFTDYTAEASFSRNPVPNSDNWTVIFRAPREAQSDKTYLACIDSVTGAVLNASCYNLNERITKNSENVQDPAWETKAIEDITKLVPENISIISSKVIAATPETGVSLVSNLSDGSAFAIRLMGDNKEAAAIQYFPNGYDGSWDLTPITENGVG
jgi:hypothetical protein